MKKYLFAGFITLLPIALTIMIMVWLFNLLTTPFVGLVEGIVLAYEKKWGLSLANHDALVLFTSQIVVLVLLFFLILFLGLLGRKVFFNLFLRLTDRLFLHIPIVKTIYRLTGDITKMMFSQGKKTFQQTVLIPFPNENTHAVGFITGQVPEAFKKFSQTSDLSVFVPTSPQPVSGFVLLTPKKYVHAVDVSVEDAFKFLVSCGVIHPGEHLPSEESK
jgi:uncharacterized membrane protein